MTGPGSNGTTATERPRRPPVQPLPPELTDALRYGSFHRALRLAISYRGLSLARLRDHLDRLGVRVGQSTLSYWQRGLRQPDVPKGLGTVRGLEAVLGLPADSLVILASTQRPPAGKLLPPTPSFTDLVPGEVGPSADRLLTELGELTNQRRLNAGMELVVVHDTVWFDPDRRQREVTSRFIVRASRSGPDRYVAVYSGDDGCRIDEALVSTVEGCRIGRIRRQPSGTSLAVELLFDRKLTDGETHVFCFNVRDDSGGESPGYFRMLRDRCSNYLLQLRFHRRALPARCSRQVRERHDVEPTEASDLACDVAGVSSGFFSDTGPGLAGITVEWT